MKGFEKYIVESWQGWDLIDTDCFHFYDCKLKKETLDMLPNDASWATGELYGVTVDLGNCKVEIINKDGESEVFNFKLVLEEK